MVWLAKPGNSLNKRCHNKLDLINKRHTIIEMMNLIKSRALVPHVDFWHYNHREVLDEYNADKHIRLILLILHSKSTVSTAKVEFAV